MTHPITGKAKKFHVVAYSSKHNPQGDANNPLPLPPQLPLLSTLKITPGIWPEWEHRKDPDYPPTRQSAPTPLASGTAQGTPFTAVASSEQPDNYRGRSPSRGAQRYQAPYPHMPPRDVYRPATHPMPYPHERYYHEVPRYPPREYPEYRYPSPYEHYAGAALGGYAPRRDPYYEEQPPYYDRNSRSPEDRNKGSNVPPSRSVEQAIKSPNMHTGTPNGWSQPHPGLTLPPLRMAIDDRTVKAPSPRQRYSPRSDRSDGSVKGEDARQLGELGKKISL